MVSNESDERSNGYFYGVLDLLCTLVLELVVLTFLTWLIFWGFGIPNWSPRLGAGLLGMIILALNIKKLLKE